MMMMMTKTPSLNSQNKTAAILLPRAMSEQQKQQQVLTHRHPIVTLRSIDEMRHLNHATTDDDDDDEDSKSQLSEQDSCDSTSFRRRTSVSFSESKQQQQQQQHMQMTGAVSSSPTAQLLQMPKFAAATPPNQMQQFPRPVAAGPSPAQIAPQAHAFSMQQQPWVPRNGVTV
eukprot:TRINITY_DN3713_c0_g1_i3.p1 TRINITY_DN3713_c0_g1~~TRINITY_DN3713_c0_g1_i3.p1  ORF type:complete len:172 (-),score=38.44 TRINITY_DN3713_c0_g1_i3:127-642(-)